MANPTANTTELDEVPFSTFKSKLLPDKISFLYGATGAAIAADRKPPPCGKTSPKPDIKDLAINLLTGKEAYPARPKYPPRQPTKAEIAAALQDGRTLEDYDLGMTPEAEKAFADGMKIYNISMKEFKAEIKEANAQDSAVAQVILTMLGPRTMTQLNNTAEYKNLKSTLATEDDTTQTTTSYKIMEILRTLFQSGTPSDMISAWGQLMNYTPDANTTAPQLIETINRLFDASTSRLQTKDDTIPVDYLKTLVMLKTLRALPGEFSVRALHRALIAPLQPGKLLPDSTVVSTLLLEEMKMAGTIDNTADTTSTDAAAFKASTPTTITPKPHGKKKKQLVPCKHCQDADGVDRFWHTAEECSKNPANKDKKRHHTTTTTQPPKVTGHIANYSSSASTTNSNAANDTATELARLRGANDAYQSMFQSAAHYDTHQLQQQAPPSDASVITTTI